MSLQQNLNQIKQLVTQTELESGRKPGSVLLLAVSKQQSIEAISELFQLGITHFGESYFQEAQPKINALKNIPICWHFIGPIQSNKTKGIATLFHWVHSISRLKIAHYLNEHRPRDLGPLNVCLQINLVDEKTKSGIPPQQATELALAVSQLPHLKLRGLMTIPPPQKKPQTQYDLFIQLNQLMHSLNQELGLDMDTLSMGMSHDFAPAIQAGATIIRVGQALFGKRQK
ncbi:pyridoxal-5'-phosphate dependent enzyme family [Legionella steigerwaltii]|uniref:Pyridoxal phosphate homeostasis protein n=1 Tax=Legionella steigerwaltii TaxID=460 RepID=A0A378LCG9_9GAMM|nr:YggS family pyridoxal phosphate-dependent enzyme [Legionella steigerwaltii]KTD79001.1 pyridoxal-5'-phosphate dependent enzyme family transporter protein [Legionella steigerwaltii]STY23592.1 pyridoxal-5'-phosphate dependent enzyme family [Legionella steigerwaltii]